MATGQTLEQLKTEAMITAPLALSDYLIAAPLVICFIAGAALLMMRKRMDWHPLIALPALVLLLAADIGLLVKVHREGPVTMMMGGWKPPFGIAFTVDMMGALFLTVAGFVALACGIFATASISSSERRYGFFPFMMLMMGGVSGAFMTGDVFNLYVWFEVLLIGSFGLLILGSEREQLDGATKYCFLNLVGTTFFLIATALLYGTFSTLNMADIALIASDRGPTPVSITIAVLYLVSFAMKAAAFPLNFWLPASYHTPRFVVSALFAGLLTKVGIYAMVRILLTLLAGERADLNWLIAWMAGLTMMVGAIGALAQSDLRRLLNFVVIAGIGTIIAGLAVPHVMDGTAAEGAGLVGLTGALSYALHSIVVMTALYLAAGSATGFVGSSSLHQMGGLWRAQPQFAAVMLILLFAVSGLPPFSGFWPKVLLVQATIAAELPWLTFVLLLSSFLLTIASARVFALAFWRPQPVLANVVGMRADVTRLVFRGPTPNRLYAILPLAALTLFVIAAGVWPEWLLAMTREAARGVLEPSGYVGSVFGSAP